MSVNQFLGLYGIIDHSAFWLAIYSERADLTEVIFNYFDNPDAVLFILAIQPKLLPMRMKNEELEIETIDLEELTNLNCGFRRKIVHKKNWRSSRAMVFFLLNWMLLPFELFFWGLGLDL